MQEKGNAVSVYDINKNYRLICVSGRKNLLFIKNRQNQLLASLEGRQNLFNQLVVTAESGGLLDVEKKYLLSFIRAHKYALSKEVAAGLGASVIQYEDGREEYLSERQLRRKIAARLDFAKVYVSDFATYALKIPTDSKNCSFHLETIKATKLIVEDNCSVNIDLRDNAFVETLVIGENFSGSVNLSRTVIESIFIGYI